MTDSDIVNNVSWISGSISGYNHMIKKYFNTKKTFRVSFDKRSDNYVIKLGNQHIASAQRPNDAVSLVESFMKVATCFDGNCFNLFY